MNEINEIEIHPKVWGEEHWIVNKEYCGKKLILKKGYRCSIHWHEIKDEVFYVTKGKVFMEVNGGERVLVQGDKQYVAPGDKHRFSGLEDSELIEFSTTHREDDSYRDEPSGKIGDSEFDELLRKYG
jgi:quercetin dioxygenase-like cupin family protein